MAPFGNSLDIAIWQNRGPIATHSITTLEKMSKGFNLLTAAITSMDEKLLQQLGLLTYRGILSSEILGLLHQSEMFCYDAIYLPAKEQLRRTSSIALNLATTGRKVLDLRIKLNAAKKARSLNSPDGNPPGKKQKLETSKTSLLTSESDVILQSNVSNVTTNKQSATFLQGPLLDSGYGAHLELVSPTKSTLPTHTLTGSPIVTNGGMAIKENQSFGSTTWTSTTNRLEDWLKSGQTVTPSRQSRKADLPV